LPDGLALGDVLVGVGDGVGVGVPGVVEAGACVVAAECALHPATRTATAANRANGRRAYAPLRATER
ncbi:MAG: hypothetical protein QOC60_1322, partial [Frankiaceae bacterium]|nr:hypothetical protein [Frankiaceae bacterium]